MESKEIFKSIVESKYVELQKYSTKYNRKATKERETLMSKHKEAYQKNPESVDLHKIAKDMFYMNGFHQADIRKMQTSFIETYRAFKEVYPEEDLSEEVTNTAKILKENLPKQIFILKDGNFEEIEEGALEKIVNDFEEKGYYKIFEAQITNILND